MTNGFILGGMIIIFGIIMYLSPLKELSALIMFCTLGTGIIFIELYNELLEKINKKNKWDATNVNNY